MGQVACGDGDEARETADGREEWVTETEVGRRPDPVGPAFDVLPGQAGGAYEIRTREGFPPTRFPHLRQVVRSRSLPTLASALAATGRTDERDRSASNGSGQTSN